MASGRRRMSESGTLLSWARERGVVIDPALRFVEVPGSGGLSVFCDHPFSSGQISQQCQPHECRDTHCCVAVAVVSIPKTACLSPRTSCLGRIVDQWHVPTSCSDHIAESLEEVLVLATHVWYECTVNASGPFDGYLTSLPAEPPTLAGFMPHTADAVLLGTEASRRIREGSELSRQMANRYFSSVVVPTLRPLLPGETLCAESFMRAVALTSSRAFRGVCFSAFPLRFFPCSFGPAEPGAVRTQSTPSMVSHLSRLPMPSTTRTCPTWTSGPSISFATFADS